LGSQTFSLLSTVIDRDDEFNNLGTSDRIVIFCGLFYIRINSNTDVCLQPTLDSGENADLVPISKWLDQIVSSTLSNIRVTRRDIILGATNKHGGAHVDLKLSVPYQVACGESPTGYFRKVADSATHSPLEATHLVSLRQMGYELLNSPDILKLVAEA